MKNPLNIPEISDKDIKVLEIYANSFINNTYPTIRDVAEYVGDKGTGGAWACQQRLLEYKMLTKREDGRSPHPRYFITDYGFDVLNELLDGTEHRLDNPRQSAMFEVSSNAFFVDTDKLSSLEPEEVHDFINKILANPILLQSIALQLNGHSPGNGTFKVTKSCQNTEHLEHVSIENFHLHSGRGFQSYCSDCTALAKERHKENQRKLREALRLVSELPENYRREILSNLTDDD